MFLKKNGMRDTENISTGTVKCKILKIRKNEK